MFDLDGTLMCETDPFCFEYMVFADYALNHADELPEEVVAVAQEIVDAAGGAKPDGMSTRHAAAAAVVYQGMTTAELAACNGKAARITVIMPFLYEGRQHRKTTRESLDCAVMLRELESMGVHSLLTFDAHDPRMQNVVPLMGLENISPALQFTQALLTEYEDLTPDSDHMMFIAPDEGATGRVVFLASLFGVNIGMFYRAMLVNSDYSPERIKEFFALTSRNQKTIERNAQWVLNTRLSLIR